MRRTSATCEEVRGNNNHIMEHVCSNPDGTANVVASLNDELLLGVWDRRNDLVLYSEPFRA